MNHPLPACLPLCQATAQLRSVLYAEERVGASAYVLDLRNNMGGIFQEALKMAALFLPDPKVSRWGGRSVGRSIDDGVCYYVPMTDCPSHACIHLCVRSRCCASR